MITKILLPEDQIPKQWYNIIPDMPGALEDYEYPEAKFARLWIVFPRCLCNFRAFFR